MKKSVKELKKCLLFLLCVSCLLLTVSCSKGKPEAEETADSPVGTAVETAAVKTPDSPVASPVEQAPVVPVEQTPAEQSAAEQSAAGQSAAEQSAAGQSAAEQSAAEQSAAAEADSDGSAWDDGETDAVTVSSGETSAALSVSGQEENQDGNKSVLSAEGSEAEVPEQEKEQEKQQEKQQSLPLTEEKEVKQKKEKKKIDLKVEMDIRVKPYFIHSFIRNADDGSKTEFSSYYAGGVQLGGKLDFGWQTGSGVKVLPEFYLGFSTVRLKNYEDDSYYLIKNLLAGQIGLVASFNLAEHLRLDVGLSGGTELGFVRQFNSETNEEIEMIKTGNQLDDVHSLFCLSVDGIYRISEKIHVSAGWELMIGQVMGSDNWELNYGVDLAPRVGAGISF